MERITEKTIDIDSILKSKMGPKAKWVPRLFVSWLKRIAHQDQVNKFLWESRDKVGTPWLEECVRYLDMTLVVKGKENLPAPDDGRLYTFVSNHPLGGIDGVALGGIVGEAFDGKIRYLVNDLLMNLKGLAPLCVGVNVMGKDQDRSLASKIDEAFLSDDQMIMFPGKLCSRRIDGRIQDLPWGKAFIRKSVMTGRQVVPVHFIAQNSKRFYRVANWCKRLGIKFNLAMLLLPDEMYKARHGTFKVVFGDPIAPETFDSSRTPYEWAQWVRSKVYEL